MSDAYITKGTRIRAQWFQASDPPSSLAGVMMKVGAKFIDVTGTCRHFRGDDPTNPSTVDIYIDPDPGTWDGPLVKPDGGCSCPASHPGHVRIKPKHVLGMV